MQRGVDASSSVGRVPPSIELLLRCLLAFRAQDRTGSAANVVRAIERELAPGARMKRAVHRRPWLAAVAASVCVGLVLCASLARSLRDPYSVRQFKAGQTFAVQGNDNAAIQCFTRSLENDPDSAQVLFARGLAYQRQAEYELAIQDFQRSSQRSADPRSLACRAYCLAQLNYHREAISLCLEAVERGHDSAELFNNLGYSYGKINQKQRAGEALSRSLQINSHLAAPHYNRAVLNLQRAAQTPDAVSLGFEDIQNAISRSPPRGEMYLVAARLSVLAMPTDDQAVDTSLQYLVQAVQYGCDPQLIASDLAFTALREHPRFRELCSKERRSPELYKADRLVSPLPVD
jgi:tetratricopeptide (TPR) repeat protein